MTRGKQTCKILKEIRRQIAEANDIEFVVSECRYKGDCLGTCPKCEAEVRYLEQQLRVRSLAGKAVSLAGISAATFAMMMPMSSAADALRDSVDNLRDTITTDEEIFEVVMGDFGVYGEVEDEYEDAEQEVNQVKGVVQGADTLSDGFVSKKPLHGATVTNLRLRVGVLTEADGTFNLFARVGDTLEVGYVGYKKQVIAVTEKMQTQTITLIPDMALMGEVVVGDGIPEDWQGGNNSFDLKVVDEEGNRIGKEKITVERIWFDRAGEEHAEELSSENIDEKHPCRVYWNYGRGFKNGDGSWKKEMALRIQVEGYDVPIYVNVECFKHNVRKTVRLKSRKL